MTWRGRGARATDAGHQVLALWQVQRAFRRLPRSGGHAALGAEPVGDFVAVAVDDFDRFGGRVLALDLYELGGLGVFGLVGHCQLDEAALDRFGGGVFRAFARRADGDRGFGGLAGLVAAATG